MKLKEGLVLTKNMRKDKDKKIPLVVLAGRPNVGKSTLFNRLTKTRSALVDDTPGVTRDIKSKVIDYDGVELEVVDTGGLFDIVDMDTIGEFIHKQSMRIIEKADIVLLLLDAKQGLTAFDFDVAKELRRSGKDVVFVVNKVDDPKHYVYASEFYQLGADKLFAISAEHGIGIDDLMDFVIERLREKGVIEEKEAGFVEDIEDEVDIKESDNDKVKLEPIRVAIIGRPNVGKSSLINAILGEPRMIVTDIAGTTRDAVDSLVEGACKYPIIFTDTAGIRRKSKVKKKLEKFSVIKAIDALKDCDIAIILMDATEGVTDQDKKLLGYASKEDKGIIAAFNKWDLLKDDKVLRKVRSFELKDETSFIPYAMHLTISAKTKKGIKKLFEFIEIIYEQYCTKIPTSTLNKALQQALLSRTPPISKGHHLKLYYTTQIDIKPPTFLIFANYPDVVPESYKRFLANKFRKILDLPYTPIKLVFRERKREGQD